MSESMLDSDGAQAASQGSRVLVVDDDPQFLDALVETVYAMGYRAEGARDCHTALHSLEREPAALVFADISMPEMNGFDLLRMVKRQYPETTVVIMTGHNLSEPAAATIKDQADGYLIKPFRQEAVRAVLDRFGTA